MINISSLALKYLDGRLWILNQSILPHKEEWLECNHPEEMIEMIRSLKVRGAPLISIAAALSLAHFANRGAKPLEVWEAAFKLREARPTAVNLMHIIDRLLLQAFPSLQQKISTIINAGVFEEFKNSSLINNYDLKALMHETEIAFGEDVLLCDRIAKYGATLIKSGDNILTHCNTGGLATAGVGTAFGVIRKAHEQGKNIHIYVDETRPLLQGGRLTTWELEKFDIPYTLICDSTAGFLMQQNKINKVFVGADRIARNGDFANKVGTYSLAVLAHYHKIPFYVVAPYTTIDPHTLSGNKITIEERSSNEVRGLNMHGANGVNKVNEQSGSFCWSPQSSPTYNPSFDITPANLITALVFDRGIWTTKDFASHKWVEHIAKKDESVVMD